MMMMMMMMIKGFLWRWMRVLAFDYLRYHPSRACERSGSCGNFHSTFTPHSVTPSRAPLALTRRPTPAPPYFSILTPIHPIFGPAPLHSPLTLPLRSHAKARFPLPELTARVDGWPVSITGQHGPCWRACVSTSRVDGPCWRVMETGHPSTRAVNSGRQLG